MPGVDAAKINNAAPGLNASPLQGSVSGNAFGAGAPVVTRPH